MEADVHQPRRVVAPLLHKLVTQLPLSPRVRAGVGAAPESDARFFRENLFEGCERALIKKSPMSLEIQGAEQDGVVRGGKNRVVFVSRRICGQYNRGVGYVSVGTGPAMFFP